MMEKELEAALSGSTVEGEVEAKLYEFSHSWRSIADEISKYDDLNGRRKNLADGEYHVGQNMVGMDFQGKIWRMPIFPQRICKMPILKMRY